MKTKPSWKPIAKGNRYCSSACGYGCTKEMYLRAVREANICKKQLGKKWKIHVWENLGWHWRVECFPFSVSGGRNPSGKMYYSVMTCDHRRQLGSGSYLWQGKDIESSDPRKVVRHEMHRIAKTVAALLEVHEAAEASLMK